MLTMKKLIIPLLVQIIIVVCVPAQQITSENDEEEQLHNYIAKVHPSRIVSVGGGKFKFIYNLLQFKAANWYPTWAGDTSVKGFGYYIPGKNEVRHYLDSLPDQVTLILDMEPCQINVDCSPAEAPAVRVSSFALSSKTDFLPSVDQLLWRGKFSDDGLMAAFEYYDEFQRKGLPRAVFYDKLCTAAFKLTGKAGARGKGARALVSKIWTARTIAGDSLLPMVKENKDIYDRITEETAILRSDKSISKPISFYCWTEKLSYIYTRDKILREPFLKDDLEAMMVLLTLLDGDTLLKKTYMNEISRIVKMTGAPKYNFTEMIKNECGDRSYQSVLEDSVLLETIKSKICSLGSNKYDKITLIPASFPPENRFTDSRDSDFNGSVAVMGPFIGAIMNGGIDLNPGSEGSWYEYQQFALKPLLSIDSLQENKKVYRYPKYKQKLQMTFKSLYAAHLETHRKGCSGIGYAAGYYPTYENRLVLMISPVNRLEPLPEVYLRTSSAYSRLASVMKTDYNDANLTGMRSKKPNASLKASKEVNYLCNLYFGFYLLSCEDIGMQPVKTPRNADFAIQIAKDFLSMLPNDNDMKQDIRFMMPVANLQDSTLYWIVNGVCNSQNVTIEFRENPEIDFGNTNSGLFTVMKTKISKNISTAEFFEIYLPGNGSINRDEFREMANTAENNPIKIKEELQKWAIIK